MANVTCHTPGCSNAEQTIELQLWVPDIDGNLTHVDAVYCGVCGQLIVDVTDDRPPEGS